MERDADWIIPAAGLVLLQHACALLLSRNVGFLDRPPTLSYMLMAFVLAALGGLALLLRKLWRFWGEGEDRPLKRLAAEADWVVIWTYFFGFQLVALQIAALTWLKEMLPLIVPYWADPKLATIDHALLMTDAWRLVPAPLVAPLDTLYPFWAPFKFFALLAVLVMPASQLKARAMLAYFLAVGLIGVCGQYLLSSGGPIFYDRLLGTDRFPDLTERIRAHAPIAHAASDYLWQSFLARDTSIGNGISAMPSMHVATTTWAAIVLGRLMPKTRLLIWGFWFIILAGSVALGWHYLSDGVVGAGGAYLCWRVAPNFLAAFSKAPWAKALSPANQS